MNDSKNGSAEKKASRKLKLNRTTVKKLGEEHLAGVAGGGTIVLCDTTDTWICQTGNCLQTVGCSADCDIPSMGKPCTDSVPKHVC